MSNRKKKSAIIGDIFIIPYNKNNFAYGQLIDYSQENQCYIIFDAIGKKEEEYLPPDKIVKSRVIYLIYSVDNRIQEGKWKIIANASIPSIRKNNEFIIDTSDGLVVQDQLGKFIRKANQKDIENLKSFSSYSPAAIEKALDAKFGEGEWQDYFEDFKYHY